MADLIDRDALLKDLRSECPESDVCISGEACIDCIVKRQPAVNRWIPCSKRMPEVDEDVIVYYSFWKDNPIQIAHLQQDYYFWETSDGEYNLPAIAVTHWMPLPESPEKE